MRRFPALFPIVILAGCCGQRANIAPAAATATVTEVRAFGVAPEIKSALTIPPDVAECFINGGTDILRTAIGTVRCAIDRIAPTVVPANAAAKAAGPACGAPVYAGPAKASPCR